jgi:hypothetical protein
MTTPKEIIKVLGFTSVRNFQVAWNLGSSLLPDGILGRKTQKAAKTSWEFHLRNAPDISEHFSIAEFRCKCGGRLQGCQTVLIQRDLLIGLEKLRKSYPEGLVIISGYRCTQHNKSIGGAVGSQHIWGRAADIPGLLSIGEMRALKIFTGIGYRSRDRKVVHVDMRAGSAVSPTTWRYA